MRKRRILLLGAGGLMGRYVMARGGGEDAELKGFTRQQLDITDEKALSRAVDEVKPDWVINAAACSRMEQCAAHPLETRLLNTDAPARLAAMGTGKGFRFCHVSSDYVLDGRASAPYGELAVAAPLSEYGRQKALADAAVLAVPGHLVIRVAWLFGRGGSTFMSRMPDLMAERPVLQVASGRTGSCLYMGLGADWMMELIRHEAEGMFNLVHPGAVTWEEFARYVLEAMKRRGTRTACRKIEVVPMAEMAVLQEPRPDYSVLSVEKLERTLGRRLEGWKEGAERYLDEILKS